MINLLPEPKKLEEKGGMSNHFTRIFLNDDEKKKNLEELLDLMQLRIWNYPEIGITAGKGSDGYVVTICPSLEGITADKPDLLKEQGYDLEIGESEAVLRLSLIHI